MQRAEPAPTPALLVACLCAEWCDTCGAYQSVFRQMQREFAQVHFVWVDIEDQSELVDPVEVENFPTLLISTAGVPCFFGTVTPHADTLRRLVQAQLEHPPEPWRGAAAVADLTARLQLLQAQQVDASVER